MINESDKVWRLVHWKYIMSQIIQKKSIKKTALTLLLPTMFDWIDERMNGSDYVQYNKWMIVIKYGD